MLGTEQVLIGVSEHFGQPFYAESKLYAKLEVVPGLKKYLARKTGKNGQILGKNERFMVPHGAFSKGNLDRAHTAKSLKRSMHAMASQACFIKPSTQWFGAKTVGKFVDVRPAQHDGVWHILYSIHNSYHEIRRFVERIRPKSVSPLVSCSKPAFREIEALCAVAPSEDPKKVDLARREDDACFSRPKEEGHANAPNGESVAERVLKACSVLDDSIELSVYECLFTEESSISIQTTTSAIATVDPAHWKSPINEKTKTLFDESLSSESDSDLSPVLHPHTSPTLISDLLSHTKRRTAPDSALSLFDIVAANSTHPLLPPSKKMFNKSDSTTSHTSNTFKLVYDVEVD